MTMNRKISFIAALFVLAPSCYTVPSQPVLGYETGDEACKDHVDNDHDGLVDCQDPDCRWTSGQCGEIIPRLPFDPKAENTAARCRDGIDNDLDGTFDCGDRNCQAIAELCCVTEFTNDRCSDGIDNDNNGFADCADYGCLQGKFVTICQELTEPACKDGKDNDGDKLIDCADSDCQNCRSARSSWRRAKKIPLRSARIRATTTTIPTSIAMTMAARIQRRVAGTGGTNGQ